MSYSENDVAKLLAANPDLRLSTPVAEAVKPATAAKLSEHEMQVAIIAECDKRGFELVFAIPNGGQRHAAVAAKLKAEGVRAGVPDIMIAQQRWGYAGMFLELKISPNKPTEAQRTWLFNLHRAGYYCRVIWDSVDEAIETIEWYLEGTNE